MKFIAALNKHLRLAGETLADFAKQVKDLTPQDKQDLRERFKVEYGYEFEDDESEVK